jgi:hypothetical protein
MAENIEGICYTTNDLMDVSYILWQAHDETCVWYNKM